MTMFEANDLRPRELILGVKFDIDYFSVPEMNEAEDLFEAVHIFSLFKPTTLL